MLRAENIRFAYRGGTPILRDVSLELAPGRVLGLLAPSGHGKSTLARILAGWERPDSGAVTLDGGPLGAHRPCRVQYLNQSPELAVDPRWRMERVLTECWPVDERTRRALGIEPGWLGRLPGGLSGGELQRFCIARALHPQLRHLVADEMTTMLDALSQAHIWNFVLNYADRNGMAVVAITHNRALAERVADRIIHIPELNHVQVDRSSL